MGESISSFEKDYTIEDASELNDILSKIEDSNNIIMFKENSEIVKSYINAIDEKLKERKNCKRKICFSTIMCVLAASLTVCLAPKKINVTKTEYTYENGIVEEELKHSNYKEDKKYILVYEPWEPNKDERIIKQYDLSDVELDSIEDYMTYDLSGLESEDVLQLFSELESSNEYNFEEIKKIINIDYDEGEYLYFETFLLLVFINFGFFLSDAFLSIFAEKENGVGLSVGSLLSYAIEYKIRFSKSGSDMKIVKEERIRLKHLINEALYEIEKNDELRNKFVKLFNENKYLLNDPTLLEEKYNELIKEVNTLMIKNEYQELKLKAKKYVN